MSDRTASTDRRPEMAEQDTERERKLKAHIRHLRAEAAYGANRRSDDILPRWVYEELGVEVPADATDEWQRMPERRRWWQLRRA